MLIETLDGLWKDPLYQMDQLRDAIHYRAFSQQDPRIEYKREGSKMFKTMLESLRDRVTDYIFKLKLTPQMAPMPQAPRPAQMAPAQSPSGGMYAAPMPQARPLPSAGVMPSAAGMISGPGLDAVAPAAPPSERAQRDLEAAQQAGANGSGGDKAQPVVKRDKAYGRNDPCPMGCGRKYKKCCNKPDGTCDGTGKDRQPMPGDESDN